MNKTTLVTGGIIAVVIVAGLMLYAVSNSNQFGMSATSTPTGTNSETNSPPAFEGTPGAPYITTNSGATPTDTTVIVTGKVTPNGAFTSYWYEFGGTPALGSKTSNQSVGSGYNPIPTPAYITGLNKNSAYYYRVVAENQFGRVAGGQHSFTTTEGNPPPVGSAPNVKTIPASGISRTTANLSGEVTPNKASTQYWFEYGASANLGNTTSLVSVGDGTGALPASQSLSNLTPSTTYYYRLNAQNQFGTVNGSILNFKTLGPAVSAPSARTSSATSINSSSATLRGSISPNGADTTYWFEYSTDSLLGAVLLKTTERKLVGTSPTSLSVTADISGLSSKTNYYFKLVAQNSSGTARGDRETFKTK